MYCEKITYEDYNGITRTEEHYFHLSKAEFMKFLTTNGDYTIDQQLQRLSDERKGREVIEIIEHMVDISYGKKSLDGRRFEKSPEILKEFKETEGYSEFFFELVTDANRAARFVAGILPKSLMDEVRRDLDKNRESVPIPKELETAINNLNNA